MGFQKEDGSNRRKHYHLLAFIDHYRLVFPEVEKRAQTLSFYLGGYEDDKDDGNVFIYTGHGGRDPKTGEQVADQTHTVGNLALARNVMTGNPVWVIRGSLHKSPYSFPSGYRYDGCGGRSCCKLIKVPIQ